jgi:hypothetical protein
MNYDPVQPTIAVEGLGLSLYSRSPGFKSWPWDHLSLLLRTLWFSQSHRANAGIVYRIRPLALPSTSFPIDNSLITLYFDAILYDLLTESLRRKLMNKEDAVWSVMWLRTFLTNAAYRFNYQDSVEGGHSIVHRNADYYLPQYTVSH